MIEKLVFCDYYGNLIDEIPWDGSDPPSTITKEVGPLKMGFRQVVRYGNWVGYRAILTEVPGAKKIRNTKVS